MSRKAPNRETGNKVTKRDAVSIAREFVEKINARDVDGLCSLMTASHRFVDSMGNVHVGRETMRRGWTQYFAMFPDYHIDINSMISSSNDVALFGTTLATYAPNGVQVKMYAAWLARVKSGRLLEWRVYADNEPARAAMRS